MLAYIYPLTASFWLALLETMLTNKPQINIQKIIFNKINPNLSAKLGYIEYDNAIEAPNGENSAIFWSNGGKKATGTHAPPNTIINLLTTKYIGSLFYNQNPEKPQRIKMRQVKIWLRMKTIVRLSIHSGIDIFILGNPTII